MNGFEEEEAADLVVGHGVLAVLVHDDEEEEVGLDQEDVHGHQGVVLYLRRGQQDLIEMNEHPAIGMLLEASAIW